ncbi:MAG: DUF1801 domain-containing protein [Cyclobacteriaceae bacterium]|jgi:uncharacterized protein YdeI (YjbR/CyaY-like superfamily)|nr:DUF1801 domain-containing protein [Cyclobacteriaceae bacterium]
MTTKIDVYFAAGCGRCALGGTPQCKVHRWPEELQYLRSLPLACGLTEEVKWGVPCYTLNGKNIVSVSALKEGAILGFFKGGQLADPDALLTKQGENSQTGRIIRFTEVSQIKRLTSTLKAYIRAAMALEQSGQKPINQSVVQNIPPELEEAFTEKAGFKKAFYALTPGRQRGYLLYFAAAKQAATRKARIEKCLQPIFDGKGMHDDYRAPRKG